jgi:two-component system sensor histidine kinase RegB
MILITGVGLLSATVLALVPTPLPWRPVPLSLPPLYLLGAWTALSMAVILIAIFTWSIAEEARRHADALTATQLALAREQKMSALGAQAAAAAHLLGSPLGTINVIAKELSRELPNDDPLHEEVMELLGQAQRCGRILASFGRPRDPAEHDPYSRAPLTTLLESIADEFAKPEKEVEIKLEAEPGCSEPALVLAAELRHALANLIDNAVQFAKSRVRVTVSPRRSGLALVIEDDGPGFSPDILDWLGEPYVSTRSGRGGMGLGVFIANTLLARTGARLHFDNSSSGARVSITWPPAAVERLEKENAHG